MIVLAVLAAIFVHHDSGPHGIVLWVQQPSNISAGVGVIRSHFIWWWQTR